MSDDSNTLVDIDTDDLNEFNKLFWERQPEGDPVEEEEEVEEEEDDTEDDNLATDEDTDASEEEDEVEEDEDLDEDPKPKPKSKAQKRIEQLVADKRHQEREIAAMRAELDRLKAVSETKQEKKDEAPALREQLSPEAPKPDAVDKDGNPIYELGEFDPKFIADLTKFTIKQQMEEAQKAHEAEVQKKQIAEAQRELQTMWNDNLEKAEEALPDIREKITDLVDTFSSLEPTYGEYLAGTIMACEHGPEIMYYLSQNIGEAQKIVASGPAAATLAIGRLEARFEKPSQDELKRNKRVSDAPPPPNARTRGSGGRFAAAPDTRDLAAFRREFFKEKP